MDDDDTGQARCTAATSSERFRDEFQETLSEVLNIEDWRVQRDPAAEYHRIETQVREAVEQETAEQRILREDIFSRLASAEDAPLGAGRHEVAPGDLIEAQRGVLFNGGVVACDGTSEKHDSLAVTIYQIGISLVSYGGNEGCWHQQLFRRDLRLRADDPVDAVIALLDRRRRREGLSASSSDELSELARRGVMSFMERFVLVHKATAPWRMGHGSPAPLELIGTGFVDLEIRSIRLVRALVEFGQFVFVASEQGNRLLNTIGQALYPLEYVVVGTLGDYLHSSLEKWRPTSAPSEDTRWDEGKGSPLSPREWLQRFREEVAPKIVYGLYRATRLAPPQLFYAHVDYVHAAARIALADSELMEQRGFPMLIDMADRFCRSIYGGGSLREMAEAAYARAGAPYRFQSERPTRPD